MSIYPKCQCAAYGCLMPGTMTLRPGSSDWWCWLHYGRDVNRYQAITAEIHRLKWLALAIRDIRIQGASAEWPEVFKRIRNDLAMAQRQDLQWLGKGKETLPEWQTRLEKEMTAMMQPVLRGSMRQQSTVVGTKAIPNTFQKVIIPE